MRQNTAGFIMPLDENDWLKHLVTWQVRNVWPA